MAIPSTRLMIHPKMGVKVERNETHECLKQMRGDSKKKKEYYFFPIFSWVVRAWPFFAGTGSRKVFASRDRALTFFFFLILQAIRVRSAKSITSFLGKASGAWSLEPGTWSLELGAWSLELRAWGLEVLATGSVSVSFQPPTCIE